MVSQPLYLSNHMRGYWEYFPDKTLASKELGNCTICHNLLPSKARLNSWINLNPITPPSLDLHSFFHFFQCIPLSGGFELHQNCAMILARFSQPSNGNSRADITYIYNAMSIDFISTSFLPLDNQHHVKPLTRFCSRSF